MSVNRKSGSTLQPLTMTMTLPAAVTEESITGVRILLALNDQTVVNELLDNADWSVTDTILTAIWYESSGSPLAPGTYKAELWIESNDGKLKAPSKSYSEVVVYASLND